MANKRKAISKKVRFEVFKRDSFRCQYCGSAAPDALLEIDHIKPVKEGGTNDIANLITACRDCNSGKGARLIDDSSVIEKQRKQLEELNERRLQLEMMMQWREGLMDLERQQLDIIEERLSELTGHILTEQGRKKYRQALKEYGLKLMLDSIDAAVNQYLKYDKTGKPIDESVARVFDYTVRICKCKVLNENKPYMKELFYIRGILRNRLNYFVDWQALDYLEQAYLADASIESLKECAKTVKNWTQFCDSIEEFLRRQKDGKST